MAVTLEMIQDACRETRSGAVELLDRKQYERFLRGESFFHILTKTGRYAVAEDSEVLPAAGSDTSQFVPAAVPVQMSVQDFEAAVSADPVPLPKLMYNRHKMRCEMVARLMLPTAAQPTLPVAAPWASCGDGREQRLLVGEPGDAPYAAARVQPAVDGSSRRWTALTWKYGCFGAAGLTTSVHDSLQEAKTAADGRLIGYRLQEQEDEAELPPEPEPVRKRKAFRLPAAPVAR